jgi:serine/threonine-protein kinase
MSPEQLMGKQLDGRSDIYALGVLGYELLTGRLPFPDAQGPAALIAAQLRKTPDLPSVARPDAALPSGVDKVILMMLEKDRAKRYADSGALQAACLEVLSADSSKARGSSQPVAIPHTVMGQVPVSVGESSHRDTSGPDTDQLQAAVARNKLWLWIALGVVVVGAALGALLALR